MVAPGCGVGHIEDVQGVELGGDSVEMYRIVLEANGMQMWVPVARAGAEGLRPPIGPDAVEAVLAAVRDTVPPATRLNWNRRQRRYREQLMSNDPMQLAQLVGELASVRQEKTLSFGERTMFERARELLQSELSAVADAGVVERLEEALAA
ncbi:MAG: hypothetical protein H6737_08870 [Alphaproteobacteria bacterium]|nr:hypothetical protein [Alphaproteobacteria bacterium]